MKLAPLGFLQEQEEMGHDVVGLREVRLKQTEHPFHHLTSSQATVLTCSVAWSSGTEVHRAVSPIG